MVKVLEKRVEEEKYSDRLWRVVLGTTAEIVGAAPEVRNLDDYFKWDKESEPIPSDARIVGIRPVDLICVDSYQDYISARRHGQRGKVEQGITVHPISHLLFVYDPAHFALARQLAEAYERRLEEGPDRQFTLQKEYQE